MNGAFSIYSNTSPTLLGTNHFADTTYRASLRQLIYFRSPHSSVESPFLYSFYIHQMISGYAQVGPRFLPHTRSSSCPINAKGGSGDKQAHMRITHLIAAGVKCCSLFQGLLNVLYSIRWFIIGSVKGLENCSKFAYSTRNPEPGT